MEIGLPEMDRKPKCLPFLLAHNTNVAGRHPRLR